MLLLIHDIPQDDLYYIVLQAGIPVSDNRLTITFTAE